MFMTLFGFTMLLLGERQRHRHHEHAELDARRRMLAG